MATITTDIPEVELGSKLAGEEPVYSIEFKDFPKTVTIVSHSVTSSNATVSTTDVDGHFVRARIAGGTPSTTIKALYTATGSDGQVLQCWALIPVRAAP